jgi:thymidylate kinase
MDDERSMLVTFEGLEGAGKSALARDVAAVLRSRLQTHVLHLPDISRSPTGRRLDELYRAEELFGDGDGGSTAISRCFAAAADLFYFDGALIAPVVAAGGVVLKERHLDTLISHEGPVLTARLGWLEGRACEWLSSMFAPMQVRPTLTILVEAPLRHRERRLRERLRGVGAAVGRSAARIDREVFRIRARWYERLRLQDEDRWLCIANPDGELQRATDRAVTAIRDLLESAPPASRIDTRGQSDRR